MAWGPHVSGSSCHVSEVDLVNVASWGPQAHRQRPRGGARLATSADGAGATPATQQRRPLAGVGRNRATGHQIGRGQALWNGLFAPRPMEGSTTAWVAGMVAGDERGGLLFGRGRRRRRSALRGEREG